MAVPCHWQCECSPCENKLQFGAAEVRPSGLLADENGLFAARDIKQGEWIATFGPVRRVGAAGGGNMEYSFPITETGSRALVYVTPIHRVGDIFRAHAMNHTCSTEHSNALITHNGEVGTKAQVLVRARTPIGAGLEIFANYGPKDEIRFFDNCPCRCHTCLPRLSG